MAKAQTDRNQTVPIEPIILKPTTVNTYKDTTILELNEFQVATDIVLDNGYVEKCPGTVKVNSDNAGTVVYGLHRAYGLVSERVALRLANGTLKSGLSAFGTTVLSNLASLVTPFLNAPNGKAYGVNYTDGIIRYTPATGEGLKTGIIGPFLRKKIAFFESDETWLSPDGGSQCSEYYRADEFSGNAIQSLKLSVSSAGGFCHASAAINLDLTAFGNSKASDLNDTISFYTFHCLKNDMSATAMTIEFSTGNTAFTTKAKVTLNQSDFVANDYQWTFWNVRKSAFIATGSPDWSSVKALRIYAYGATGKTPTVYIDDMHLKITQLKVTELRTQLASFDTSETWTNVSGGSLATDNSIYVQGFCSMKQTASGRNTKSLSLDLTQWPDGNTIEASDDIAMQVRTTARANITGIKLILGTAAGVYWAHNLSATDYPANNQWFDVKIRKSQFSAVGGISVWSSITRIDLSCTFGGATTVWFDDCRVQPYDVMKQLSTCETTESWTFNSNSEISDFGKGVVEGVGCLHLNGTGTTKTITPAQATLAMSATRNMAAWDDGTASSTDDLISFNLYHTNIKDISYLAIYFGDSAFTNYYTYQLLPAGFAGGGVKNNQGGEIQIAKSLFTAVGSPNWNSIADIRFTLQAKNGGDAYIDDVEMKRKPGITGRYYYKFVYGFRDIKSAFSEESEAVDARGSYISISLMKSSVDSRIVYKELYRLGGEWPDTWMRVGVIPNGTETYIDKAQDVNLDYPLGNDIPDGNINNVGCSNLAYNLQSDVMLYWGDPNNKDRVYQSNPVYYHVVPETSYRSFSGEVMGVVPFHGYVMVVCKNGVTKVAGDLLTGDMIDLPVPIGACSYYATEKISEGLLVYVGADNAYLLDGYRATPIGEEIKNYFKGRESYLSTVQTRFCSKDRAVYIACMDSSGTPTYNSKVLRYYIPNKSWTVLNWNVNVFSQIWNGQADDNSLWYGDSNATTGDVVKTGSATYQYKGTAISSQVRTGWWSIPNFEMAINQIEFKVKGSGGTLTIKGYKNLSDGLMVSPAFTGTVTPASVWITYVIQGYKLTAAMTGDHLELDFTHPTDNQSFFLKDVVVTAEKNPKRVVMNEVTIT